MADQGLPRVRLGRGKFGRRFLRRRIVRAPNDDAAEQRGDRRQQQPRIERDHAEQNGGKQNGAAHDGDAPDQDEFAAAFELGGKFLDLRLEALDLVVGVGVGHRCQVSGIRNRIILSNTTDYLILRTDPRSLRRHPRRRIDRLDLAPRRT